jgi:hypothetical protein
VKGETEVSRSVEIRTAAADAPARMGPAVVTLINDLASVDTTGSSVRWKQIQQHPR